MPADAFRVRLSIGKTVKSASKPQSQQSGQMLYASLRHSFTQPTRLSAFFATP
jgi:hypothetical protein